MHYHSKIFIICCQYHLIKKKEIHNLSISKFGNLLLLCMAPQLLIYIYQKIGNKFLKPIFWSLNQEFNAIAIPNLAEWSRALVSTSPENVTEFLGLNSCCKVTPICP